MTKVIRCVGKEKATWAGLAFGRSEGHLHTDLIICSLHSEPPGKHRDPTRGESVGLLHFGTVFRPKIEFGGG